jgi:hypothetical protein
MSARPGGPGPTFRDKSRKFMLEPYLDWAEAEGVPIYEDFAIDMLSIEAKPWGRFGLNGAICHLKSTASATRRPTRCSTNTSTSRRRRRGTSRCR